MKKVAIIGTVGVPANYGGFETLVENLVSRRRREDIRYTVYCSARSYPERLPSYKGAELRYVGLRANGVQSIIYDTVSLLRAIHDSDCILLLGVSGCVSLPLVRMMYRKRLVINIDGLEHRRQKWNSAVRAFLKASERLAVRFADTVVCDNSGIADYVAGEYGAVPDVRIIEYGGDHAVMPADSGVLSGYGLEPGGYSFKVARIEPENNIGMVLEAFSRMPSEVLAVVGNWDRSLYGRELRAKYGGFGNIRMIDPVYDPDVINALRGNCRLYVHGHSAGGTNPSLVEAMWMGLPVVAFDVVYNRATTENAAVYFTDATSLAGCVGGMDGRRRHEIASKMREIAVRRYRWERICGLYEELF